MEPELCFLCEFGATALAEFMFVSLQDRFFESVEFLSLCLGTFVGLIFCGAGVFP